METVAAIDLRSIAQTELRGENEFLFFDDRATVLCSSFKVESPEADLLPIKSIFGSSREDALRVGLRLQNQRYEVHVFEPPLIYGRTMGADPALSEGIALCKVERGPSNGPAFGLVTFALPELTAKQVPQLVAFCNKHLQQRFPSSTTANPDLNSNHIQT